jgi:hypothetical protein
LEGEIGNENAIAEMKINTEKGFLKKEDYINNFMCIFPNLEIKMFFQDHNNFK